MTWSLGAEARVHPLGVSSVDPWFGGYFGITAIRDSVIDYGPDGHYLRGAVASQHGPGGGLALGMDFRALSFLALGFEIRGGLSSFGHDPPVIKDDLSAPDYGTLTSVSLGLGGTFLLFEGE